MVKKLQVFMASSKRALPLAKALRSRIRERDASKRSLQIHPWWLRGAVFAPGKQALTSLIDVCKKSDFAVVLLTKDDVLREGDDEDEYRVPRDNCILEAGLFTGGLGLEPDRCFLVVAEDAELPTDLQGLTLIKFNEPSDLKVREQCRRAMGRAAGDIIRQIKELRWYSRPQIGFVPEDKLIEVERLRRDGPGGKLQESALVLVQSAYPIERDGAFAERVITNLAHGCKYQYFFQGGDEDTCQITAELIQALAAVGIEGGCSTDWLKGLTRKLAIGQRNLKTLKKQLKIYFVEHEKPIYCCIHNAHDPHAAICYLRYPDPVGMKSEGESAQFVQWFTREKAFHFAAELKRLHKDVEHTGGVFCSTSEFALAVDGDFRASLWDAVKELFPEKLHTVLHEACFGEQLPQN